jgi:uncharacterized membrane-anchored protein YjiN (DUF445 family)
MAFNDKQKKRFVAIARQLKQQKNITIKQNEIVEDLKRYKKAQEDVLTVKEQYKGNEAVSKAADESYQRLQKIIGDLNEYMNILHPEGLIDFGSGKGGKQILSQG